ncbi:unnamed protein product [Brassica napus]|uniref:(rape) hypothetical protein n=1 Tax=Brassica napus TaxID=3708 RepID=A0A816XD66_BRANA|nr:unnamed protein product [Brassica napus]
MSYCIKWSLLLTRCWLMHTSPKNVQTTKWRHSMKRCRNTKGKLIEKLETHVVLQQGMA